MEKLDLENKELVFGKLSLMSDSLKGMTKADFEKRFGGILLEGVNDAWKQVKKYTKDDVQKPKPKAKKSK